MKKNHLSDFCSFIKNNTIFTACVCVSALLTYFVILGGYTVSYDTDIFMGDEDYVWLDWKEKGRFGLILLKILFSPHGLNLHMADGLAVFFLILGTLLWVYYITVFCSLFGVNDPDNKESRLIILLPAVIFYITSGVWQEQIYYQLQSAEVMLAVCLCPVSLMILAKGIREKRKDCYAVFMILTVFMLSVYQAVIMMEAAGILIFLYSEMCRGENIKSGSIKAFVMLAASLAVYLMIAYILKTFVFRVESTGFISANIRLGKERANPVLKLAGYVYMLLFANVGFLSRYADPVIASHSMTGEAAVDYYHSAFQDIASVLYIPAVLIFVISAAKDYFRSCRDLKKDRTEKVSGTAVIFLIPLSVLFFPVAGAGDIKVRVQFVLPLVAMFLFMYSIDLFLRNHSVGRNRASLCVAVLVPLIVLYSSVMQGEKVSMLFMSDMKVFEHDRAFAADIEHSIRELMNEEGISEDTPVYLYGSHVPVFDRSMTHGEFIGKSVFSRGIAIPGDTNKRGTAFMRIMGYGHTPCRSLTVEDMEYVSGMPVYPVKGSVSCHNDRIIVKLSEGQ